VVVDAGDGRDPSVEVVRGIREAIRLLLHGLAGQPGLAIDERSVNSQPGLMLHRFGVDIANITIDFVGPLIGVVWVRLHPEAQRRWNHV
jgi:hypothetical protein